MNIKIIIAYFFFSIIIVFNSFAGDINTFYYVSDDDNNLYSVNKNTGVSTLIGATGVSDIEAIAYYPVPGANVLYAVNLDDFGTLNLSTGAFTLIEEIDADGLADGALGPQALNNVDGMMLDGQTFIMWATQRSGGNDLLFQIDVTTGKYVQNAFGNGVDYTVITGAGINVDVDDLAISPVTGRMYASNNDGGVGDNLIEINKFNATYSVATALAEDDVEGLAFHNDGILYGSEGDDDRFSEINLTTGAMTNQLALSGGDVECFASLVADANTVSGTIFDDADLDGILDGGESGVSGVTVYLYLDNNGDGLIDPEDTRLQTTASDVGGNYEFYYASTADLLLSTEFSSYPASSALTTDNLETASFTDAVNFAEIDANNNFGIGTGPDCDGDGLPNFFEGGRDSDGDAVRDSCDLDSDNDGIRDDVEGIEDFDDDGIPNYRDRDADDDGIPDAIEANRGAEPTGYNSAEGNISGAVGANGIVDGIETAAESGVMVASNPDSDNDGHNDFLDLDSDNDGILDILEAGGEDSDNDGQVDGLIDLDTNGYDDRIESTPLTIANTDETFEDANGLTNLPNYIDIDSDSDGIDDTREGYSTADYDFPTILRDSDGDGILDFWDISNFATPITPYDRDSDDDPDYIDSDSDNDGVTDLIEGNDANADGVVDVALSGIDSDNNGLDDALDGLCGQSTIYATTSDFAEENLADGSVELSSGDLELVNDIDEGENQLVGIQFSNITVNQGQTITSAYVQFEADEVSTGSITIIIEGELSTNAPAFTDTDDDVSDRTRTVAQVSWSPEDWTVDQESGVKQQTADISSILQEIVNQGGWSNGNNLVLLFSGPTGNTRIAETDPVLVINKEFDPTPTLSIPRGEYAEEDNSGGAIDLGSSDLEMPNDGGTNQTVGVLFNNVGLEQGQIVTSAYIQFQADGNFSGAVTLTIEGELATSAASYDEDDDDNVSTRTTTTATPVSWSPADWSNGDEGAAQQTPDLAVLIQEIVDQAGWDFGNNMSFIITGPGGGNSRRSENDPILVIETSASFTVCASNVAHQDFDNDGEDDFRDTDDDADGISTSGEIPDDDGSGTPDYLEFDGDECGLGFIATGYTDDYTGVQDSQNNTTNPGNLTGSPDGNVTLFNANNDEYIVDFEQVYPAGYRYIITWREDGGQSGTAEIVLAESDDDVTYNGRPINPTTNSTTLFADTITAQFDFQYLRFRLENAASSTDFEIDAVGVMVPTCAVDSDDDSIADSDDIDDDNDGVLDVNESTGANNPVGDEDGDGTLNFEDVVDNGNGGDGSTTNYTDSNGDGIADVHDFDLDGVPNHLDLDSDNDGVPDIQEAGGSDRDVDSDGRVDNPADGDGDGWANVFDSDGGGTALADGDQDSDGLGNRIDLDADDDGIADIIEAGGVDTDGDGQVDSFTDTDGDGLADTFDNDNSGTPLPVEDEDGDNVQNYLDLDSDSDGIIDNVEGQTTANFVAPLGTDFDNDGWDDRYDGDVTGGINGTPIVLSNNEGFGNPDYLDDDSDGDGLPDWIEGFDDDENGDALNDLILRANNYESAAGNPLDYVTSDDADMDGVPDFLEDIDTDGTPNFLDEDNDAGFYQDTDNDGMVDLYDSESNGSPSTTPDADGDGEYDFRDTDNQVSLPVELISFSAILNEDQVILSWSTATEINNDHFIVERSTNGKDFVQVLKKAGSGNTTMEMRYQDVDPSPEGGYNYYRLSQVDFDRTIKQYDDMIRVVEFEGNRNSIKVYPNPSNGKRLYLVIEAPEEGTYQLKILNTKGQLITEKEIDIEENNSHYVEELLHGRSLTKGIYFINLYNKNRIEVIQFVIQ